MQITITWKYEKNWFEFKALEALDKYIFTHCFACKYEIELCGAAETNS